ncbi:MAG: hydroxymethylglutaryl-CoA lyase [Candidatus Kapaibacterium sp.]
MQEIKIHEVGLRDGLQMVGDTVPTENKLMWANEIMASGIDMIQLGSFVNPKVLFQMSDTDDLFEHFSKTKPEGVTFTGLVLNEKGVERGMACGVEMFCMGVSASETHSQKNTRMGVDEATDRIIAMAKGVMESGKRVQASVQSAFGCGFEGQISEIAVLNIVARYFEAGINMISLADTAGHANPRKVEKLFTAIRKMNPEAELACHFHNTYGMGLANCLAALSCDVKYFETAFGGLGGCPFTKVAAGNVATEDLVHMLQNMQMLQNIDLDKSIGVARYVSNYLMRELPGYVYKLGPIKK